MMMRSFRDRRNRPRMGADRLARLGVEDSVPGIADAIASRAGSTGTRLREASEAYVKSQAHEG